MYFLNISTWQMMTVMNEWISHQSSMWIKVAETFSANQVVYSWVQQVWPNQHKWLLFHLLGHTGLSGCVPPFHFIQFFQSQIWNTFHVLQQILYYGRKLVKIYLSFYLKSYFKINGVNYETVQISNFFDKSILFQYFQEIFNIFDICFYAIF